MASSPQDNLSQRRRTNGTAETSQQLQDLTNRLVRGGGTVRLAKIMEITEAVGRVVSAEYLRNAIELVKRNIAALISTGMVVAGSAMLLPALAILALNAVGFTLSGVAAGSLAAAIQSLFYGASTTGLFSILQSLGATAVIGSPVLPIVGGVLVGVGIIGLVGWKIYKEHRDAASKDSGDGDDDEDPDHVKKT
ncbi:hypothetical protein C8J56DRAFT_161533 [Mycena floridula]|nr:hypothetical protein C8J56DRAFT_161533 [Mycena floridula]